MKVSKDTEEQYIDLVRRILAAKPDAPVIDLQKQLERNNYHFSWGYVQRLKHKAQRSIKMRMRGAAKYAVIGDFANKMAQLQTVMWSVVMDGTQPTKTKIAAAKEAHSLAKDVVNMMFDAGLIVRKLGTIDLNTIRENKEVAPEVADNLVRVLEGFGLIAGKVEKETAEQARPRPWAFEEQGLVKAK